MGGTWNLDPDGFLLRDFPLIFFLNGGCVLADRSPPSSRVASFPPLVAAVLITPKGAESPGSGRIRVIGAFVFVSI